MGHLGFVLKIGIIAIVLVMLMQIKIGENTIENHAQAFIKSSFLTEPIREVSEGGFVVLRSAYQGSIKLFDSLVSSRFRSDSAPGKRKITEIKRSSSFEKEQEARRHAEETDADEQ